MNSWNGIILKPVTQVADAEVKNAWKKEISFLKEIGRLRSSVPMPITERSEVNIIRPAGTVEVNLRL